MSTETERRVGGLLKNSQGLISNNDSGTTSSVGNKASSIGTKVTDPVSNLGNDSAKEKLNIELKQKQEKMKVTC